MLQNTLKNRTLYVLIASGEWKIMIRKIAMPNRHGRISLTRPKENARLSIKCSLFSQSKFHYTRPSSRAQPGILSRCSLHYLEFFDIIS